MSSFELTFKKCLIFTSNLNKRHTLNDYRQKIVETIQSESKNEEIIIYEHQIFFQYWTNIISYRYASQHDSMYYVLSIHNFWGSNFLIGLEASKKCLTFKVIYIIYILIKKILGSYNIYEKEINLIEMFFYQKL
jgi:hypothetical protein